MTEPIRTCDERGAFAGERCPICGARGTQLIAGDRRRRLSKFVSGALRHFPDDIGLELDERGWAAYDDLVSAVESRYGWADLEHVDAVIATDPKGRFERTGGDDSTDGARGDARVRAAYGHSVDVDLEPTDAPVPDELYHGTASENVESTDQRSATRRTGETRGTSIREDGLRPMGRQQVHLAGSREEARRVGRRHAIEPVILVVDAAAMLADGHRIAKRGRETYTTDRVPPRYLDL